MVSNEEKRKISENIYLKINQFIERNFEEQKLKLLFSDKELSKIKLTSTYIEENQPEEEVNFDHYYEITYYFNFYTPFSNEEATVLCRLTSFYINQEIENIRCFAYYGAMLEYHEDEVDGITEEYSEYDKDEIFLLEFLEEISLMDYIKNNNFDALLIENINF